jgi:hypothetical protein
MLIVQYGQIPKKFEATVIWGKWRLVNGTELYDIHAGPAQERDVAGGSPDVLARMRAHYEKWWAPIEPTLRDFLPLSIGAPEENPVVLCSSDWEEIYADNPGHVSSAAGGPRGGPWNIFVERSGEYEIRLSRWPPELNLALTAGREAQKMTAGQLPVGKAVPIAGARLTVSVNDLSVATKPSDTVATFRVKLGATTKTKLHGWFVDAKGADVCGAFYAEVKLL